MHSSLYSYSYSFLEICVYLAKFLKGKQFFTQLSIFTEHLAHRNRQWLFIHEICLAYKNFWLLRITMFWTGNLGTKQFESCGSLPSEKYLLSRKRKKLICETYDSGASNGKIIYVGHTSMRTEHKFQHSTNNKNIV